MRSHLLVGGMWALVLIAPCRMQIMMLLLMGRMLAQWLGSMDSTEAGGRGASAMVDDKGEGGIEHEPSIIMSIRDHT
jgi:hypothetical protein